MVLPQGFWKYTVDQLRAGCEEHGIETTECKHCSSTVTVSKCATSNLITHLKRHHPPAAKQSSVTSFVSCTPQKWKSTDYRQQATTDLLVQFIAESLQPLCCGRACLPCLRRDPQPPLLCAQQEVPQIDPTACQDC